ARRADRAEGRQSCRRCCPQERERVDHRDRREGGRVGEDRPHLRGTPYPGRSAGVTEKENVMIVFLAGGLIATYGHQAHKPLYLLIGVALSVLRVVVWMASADKAERA